MATKLKNGASFEQSIVTNGDLVDFVTSIQPRSDNNTRSLLAKYRANHYGRPDKIALYDGIEGEAHVPLFNIKFVVRLTDEDNQPSRLHSIKTLVRATSSQAKSFLARFPEEKRKLLKDMDVDVPEIQVYLTNYAKRYFRAFMDDLETNGVHTALAQFGDYEPIPKASETEKAIEAALNLCLPSAQSEEKPIKYVSKMNHAELMELCQRNKVLATGRSNEELRIALRKANIIKG